MKTTFITTYDYEGQPNSTITYETDAVELGDMLLSFEDHLKGCGFIVDGRLAIVPHEEI